MQGWFNIQKSVNVFATLTSDCDILPEKKENNRIVPINAKKKQNKKSPKLYDNIQYPFMKMKLGKEENLLKMIEGISSSKKSLQPTSYIKLKGPHPHSIPLACKQGNHHFYSRSATLQ